MQSAIVTGAGSGIGAACARLETLAAELDHAVVVPGHIGDPKHVTARENPAVVAFLLSAEAAYVNGAELPVDSGATAVDVSGAAWTSA